MTSLALWYKAEGESHDEDIDLHINYWKLPVKYTFFGKVKKVFTSLGLFHRFIDIGLKIENINNVSEIYLYTPFKVSESDIIDLGSTICQNNKGLLNAIFNKQYKITSNDSKYYEITDDNGKEVFNIYTLESEDISISDANSGSLVTIKLPTEINKKAKTYLRFRIKSKEIICLSSREKNPSSVLSNAFTKIEITDFRINSLRHLPPRIIEKINEDNAFVVKKVHFFYICSYKENFLLSHIPFSGARQLENNTWDDYISTISDNIMFPKKETYIAYHWSKSSEGNSKGISRFNSLLKTDYKHNNWSTIIKYLLFLVIFSVVTSILSSYIYDNIKNRFFLGDISPTGQVQDILPNSTEDKGKK